MPDNLLSQAEIDALVAQNKDARVSSAGNNAPGSATGETRMQPGPENKPPAVKNVSLAGVQQARAAPAGTSLPRDAGAPSDLEARLRRLEAAVQRVQASGGSADGAANTELQLQVRDMMRHIQRLDEQMKAISARLQGTPGYDAYHTFQCDKCQSRGTVAVILKCTSCGKEGWRGWWPSRRPGA